MSPLSEGPDTDATESQLSASAMSTDMRISSNFIMLVSETARNTHDVVCSAVNIDATDSSYSQLSLSSTTVEIWSGRMPEQDVTRIIKVIGYYGQLFPSSSVTKIQSGCISRPTKHDVA
ncbi:hypothetical protein A0H81_06995 [Grifola frondosa]|uniref:Uncharacterized protein n=1 Tax=Grifola frondosa TaxID=5627 RepID=A0A1C7M9N6_GRIFR|nr:hypothetical protein A0H81_06995 [Grifola frondosa]